MLGSDLPFPAMRISSATDKRLTSINRDRT